MCHRCKNERSKKYYATKKGKEVVIRTSVNYRKRYPERDYAYHRVLKLEKGICEVCGSKNVHGHHPDYSKPVEVVWLCPLHHAQLHTKLRADAKLLKENI